MTSEPKGQEVVAEGQQPVVMPTTTKPVEVSTAPPAEVRPTETPAPSGELPQGVSERTAAEFEKLKESNRAMAEKLKQYEVPKRSAFDMFAPQEVQQPVQQRQVVPQTAQPKTEDIRPVVPDENGLVDIDTLNQTIAQVNERTRRSEEAARAATFEARRAEDRVAKYEHTDKTLKTYAKHPYLDPTSAGFDERFSELTKLEILRQMTEEGRQDYQAAADRVKEKYYDPTLKPQAPAPDPKKIETVAKRDQINATSGVQRSDTPVDHERLVKGTYSGDKDAIYQRLKKSGY